MAFHHGNMIKKSFTYTLPYRELVTMKSILPTEEEKSKKSNSQVTRAQRKSQSLQKDKKYRCELTKPSSVGRCWKPHHWKCLSPRKKNKLQKVVWVFFSPGGDIPLFSPILSKDLSGPLSTSSKKFVWIVSKNICLINVKIR